MALSPYKGATERVYRAVLSTYRVGRYKDIPTKGLTFSCASEPCLCLLLRIYRLLGLSL